MPDEVKEVAALESPAGHYFPNNATHHSPFWLLYFLLTIAGIGAALAYGLAAPFLLVGQVNNRARKFGGRVMVEGIDLLLKFQPWLKADISLRLPPGAFTISNHRSHLDMFILLARIKSIRAVAKDSLFRIPFLGTMMRLMKMIPVQNGSRDSYLEALHVAEEAARSGDPVYIFPEGQRCPLGFKGILPFKLAPFKMMKDLNHPVFPIVFKDTDAAWPKGKFGLSYRTPIQVFNLPPLYPGEYTSAEALREEAWKRISEALH